jgi:transcriptional repressor NrdR
MVEAGFGREMCPFCKEDNDKANSSSDAGRVIRRRRQCLVCKRRFTTYEKTGENIKLHVVKKDKSRVPYDRDKVVVGVQKACYKRPVSPNRSTVAKPEEDIFRSFDKR